MTAVWHIGRMSKERAQRRAEREREAAIQQAARAAEAERRERRAARRRTFQRVLPGARRAGRPTGALARRRRVQIRLLVAVLVSLNVIVWVIRPDWPARLGALVLTLLVFPMLAVLTRPGRR